jgi:glycosyltransferase involved in cell wall biosynthesis
MAASSPGNDPRVSIVVPAFNEEGNIEELCRRFAAMQAGAAFTFEVVMVDDGSTDGTGALLASLRSRYNFLNVLTHSHNRGLTEALQTGFAHARGDIFVFYPADLQYHPEDIPAMIAKIDEGNDMVTGWKQGQYGKRFVSSVYNALSRRIFGLKVHDLNSVKAFRREVVEGMFLRRDWHRYLVAMAVQQGYRVDEVKMPLYPRYSGQSKFSGFWRIPVGVLDMLAVKSQMTLLKKPLLFFGVPGAALIVTALIIGLIAVYLRVFLNAGHRPLLYLVILLSLMGVSFFILGFLAEALTAIKEELAGVRRAVQKLESEINGRKADSDEQDR